MNYVDLENTARALVPKTKGILAADESFNSTVRRFARYDIPHTEENRRAYRNLLFTTSGLEEFISGIIMFDESIRQTAYDGTLFPEYMKARGIIPGIKIDGGYQELPGYPGETFTLGLDGLRERLAKYHDLGARFTKWRAPMSIGDGKPSRQTYQVNAEGLAISAALSQEAGLVPIVEPDISLQGAHSIERCAEVTEAILAHTFYQLSLYKVHLEGILLKVNMVIPGKDCPVQDSPEVVADYTIRTYKRTVPVAVPGIVFLSGGQGSQPAIERLNAVNQRNDFPWEISFSFLRSLADPAYDVWKGDPANFEAAQKEFYRQAKMTALARQGKYHPGIA
jgi:fructose-bisphosphate aldolase class I